MREYHMQRFMRRKYVTIFHIQWSSLGWRIINGIRNTAGAIAARWLYSPERAERAGVLKLIHNHLGGRHTYVDQRDAWSTRNTLVNRSALWSPAQIARGEVRWY